MGLSRGGGVSRLDNGPTTLGAGFLARARNASVRTSSKWSDHALVPGSPPFARGHRKSINCIASGPLVLLGSHPSATWKATIRTAKSRMEPARSVAAITWQRQLRHDWEEQ